MFGMTPTEAAPGGRIIKVGIIGSVRVIYTSLLERILTVDSPGDVA
jgi:hypothetical protein